MSMVKKDWIALYMKFDKGLFGELEALANKTHRSRTRIMECALREYLLKYRDKVWPNEGE